MRIAAWPRRIVRNISVATRLSLVILLVALISLVITSVVGLHQGGAVADRVLRAQVTSIGAARADEVERYVASLQLATIGQAISPSTAQAINEFSAAYRDLDTEQPAAADEEALNEYYSDVVAPELSAIRGRPVNAASLVPEEPAAITLQASYVVPSGGLLADAVDGSDWSALHRELHAPFDEFAIQAGVDDLYLIEPNANTIVYSTAKNPDFATSLLTGPQSGSALAVLIQSFNSNPSAGTAAIRDFTSYAAAGDEPSLFVASPVYDGNSLAGFVAVRIGPERISSITTNDGIWSAEGDTGETYVVASDNLMRSDARGFIEDESTYLTAVAAAGATTESQTRAMRSFGTTVLFQPINDKDVNAALDLEPSLAEATSFLGVDVLQARRSLEIDGLDWAMMSEIELQEIEQPVIDFARNLLIAIALFLVAITFISTRWTDRLLQTLRIVSTRLRAIRSGGVVEAEGDAAVLPGDAPTEFVKLAADIDTMLETLTARNADAADRAAERRRLLRQILPPQAAQRAEAGDRNVVDQVAHATVAVIVIDGLGPLMRAGAAAEARSLLDRFVDETDALARQRGLERIRLTGDAYFAACGTVRPHIDHAARAASFVLDVRDLIRDLSDEHEQISITAGIDSGPVTVALTGGSDLVYDAWGPTVQNAADLARTDGSNTIFATPAVQAQLSSDFIIELPPGENAFNVVVISGRAHEGEPAQ
ncbi:MAG: class 3 adenylate cyclase [Ilumatobacter sp.]|jgi:class 3 adenylate cyclase